MGKEVQKKTGVVLLLISIILAIIITMYVLNYTQTPKFTNAESKESSSGGEITLTVKKPPVVRDQDKGGVSLTVLSSGG